MQIDYGLVCGDKWCVCIVVKKTEIKLGTFRKQRPPHVYRANVT